MSYLINLLVENCQGNIEKNAEDRAFLIRRTLKGAALQNVNVRYPSKKIEIKNIFKMLWRIFSYTWQEPCKQLIAPSNSTGKYNKKENDSKLTIIPMGGVHKLEKFLRSHFVFNIVRSCNSAVLVVKESAEHEYRNLLIATDFSISSRVAALEALKIAPRANVTLFHAYALQDESLMRELGLRNSEIRAFRKNAEKQALDKLQMFSNSVLNENTYFDTRIVYGTAAPSIQRYAESIQADLIVVGSGTHTRGFKLLGGRSLTRRLISMPSCDLLIGPSSAGTEETMSHKFLP